MKLGSYVKHIRNNGVYSQYRSELVNVGFEWDPGYLDFLKLYRAIQHYKIIHGDVDITIRFRIDNTTNNGAWPKEFWNISLGESVYGSRTNQASYSNIVSATSNCSQGL